MTALIKGETSCNREACQAEFRLPRWRNISTRQWYCRGCAVRINRYVRDSHQPVFCEYVGEKNPMVNPVLCYEEGSPEFLALAPGDKP